MYAVTSCHAWLGRVEPRLRSVQRSVQRERQADVVRYDPRGNSGCLLAVAWYPLDIRGA